MGRSILFTQWTVTCRLVSSFWETCECFGTWSGSGNVTEVRPKSRILYSASGGLYWNRRLPSRLRLLGTSWQIKFVQHFLVTFILSRRHVLCLAKRWILFQLWLRSFRKQNLFSFHIQRTLRPRSSKGLWFSIWTVGDAPQFPLFLPLHTIVVFWLPVPFYGTGIFDLQLLPNIKLNGCQFLVSIPGGAWVTVTVKKMSNDHWKKHSERQWHIHISQTQLAPPVFLELHIRDSTSTAPYMREAFVRIMPQVSFGMLVIMLLIGAGFSDPS